MDQVAKHIIFIGRVQGVGFRFTALRIANRYGLTGFVRNMPDGTVEMLAQGHSDEVAHCLADIDESFTGYIRESKIEELTFNPQHTDFKITF
jgi:acylphosphatase